MFIGGNTAVHQFVRIGEGAMLGGVSGITRDVIPFGFAFGPKADLVGINVVGLKRKAFPAPIFTASGAPTACCSMVREHSPTEPAWRRPNSPAIRVVTKILSFIREGESRPLMMPAAAARQADLNAAHE